MTDYKRWTDTLLMTVERADRQADNADKCVVFNQAAADSSMARSDEHFAKGYNVLVGAYENIALWYREIARVADEMAREMAATPEREGD